MKAAPARSWWRGEIHKYSRRSGGPFVAINAAALPETLIESELFGHERGAFTGAMERSAGCFVQAHGGTLFLDEIGEMPQQTQPKLLRVLEDLRVRRLGGKHEIPVDARVLAATSQALETHLREELYYRLSVFQIVVPPLREHKEDIPAIVEVILQNLNKKHGTRVIGVDAAVVGSLSTLHLAGQCAGIAQCSGPGGDHGRRRLRRSEGYAFTRAWHQPRAVFQAIEQS